MLNKMKSLAGMVLTVTGPMAPAAFGKVLMHEHLHSDLYDWQKDGLITEERPTAPGRLAYLLNDAVPLLRECREPHGMGGYVDATMPPWRAWPDVYEKVSRASGVRIVLATGFYREIELGSYFAKTPGRQIWPFVRRASVEQLTELCVREIVEGIHGTSVCAGCIKLGSSQAPMTPTERKTFVAAARAQQATGVHVTTHCSVPGAETSQLTVLDGEGVDLRRVVIGHTGWHIGDKLYRRTVLEWMKRGANFLPTNLDVGNPENWRPLIDGIHAIFDAGHGDKLCFGLDSGYCSEAGPFTRVNYMPLPPFLYMFTHVLPAFRALGLTHNEEEQIMTTNPARIIPIA
ncbi:MAG TPA: hypothetical protein VM487_23335 [Phycisphaerae bacterium]|nr:hypothetical protein [Phycisphaerae bacterium]HUW33329.1 hypothetical protein [Planctomycetota bacterium]